MRMLIRDCTKVFLTLNDKAGYFTVLVLFYQGLSATVIEAYNMLSNLSHTNLLQNLWNPSFFQEKAIIAPTHEMVDIINERMLSLLLGDENEYESSYPVCLADEDLNFDDSIYTTEFLNFLRMFGIPNHSIKFKICTAIMLMCNINQRACLCNGTRLQVLRLGIKIIEAQIISGGSVGTICAIPRMSELDWERVMGSLDWRSVMGSHEWGRVMGYMSRGRGWGHMSRGRGWGHMSGDRGWGHMSKGWGWGHCSGGRGWVG
nr:ATP-dependent DNA helicase PIF1-like [Tanacetum cinerariifolium]